MKKLLVSIVFMVALLSNFCFAEERFVGEFAGDGYYAEVDNITISGDYLVTYITVKKPYYNKFIKELVRFDKTQKTYEILKREIYQYNPQELVETQKPTGIVMPMSDDSPYAHVMRFVYDWQKRTEYDI